MGKIYCVMGKSSSGKDTVYKKLKEQYKEFRLIVPYTTRPIREGEKDGVEYYFVDPEQFRAMKEDGNVPPFSCGRGGLFGRKSYQKRDYRAVWQ